MAYCEKCGAYIPDGQSKCLACNFDIVSGVAAAAQEASAQNEKKPDAIEELFEERRKQQAEEWARQELEHRREQERRRDEAEKRRRLKEKQIEEMHSRSYSGSSSSTRKENTSTFSGSRSGKDYSERIKNVADEIGNIGKDIGSDINSGGFLATVMPYMSYLGVLCFVPLLMGKEDVFTHFHAKQGLTVLLLQVLCAFFNIAIPFAGIFTIIGLINVYKREMKPLPIIGNLLDKLNL